MKDTMLRVMDSIPDWMLSECEQVRAHGLPKSLPRRPRFPEFLGYAAVVVVMLMVLIVAPVLLPTKPVAEPDDTTAVTDSTDPEETTPHEGEDPVELYEILDNEGGMTVVTVELPVPEGHAVYAFALDDRHGGYAVGEKDENGYCRDGYVIYLLDRETGRFVMKERVTDGTYFPQYFHKTENGGILYGMDEDNFRPYAYAISEDTSEGEGYGY